MPALIVGSGSSTITLEGGTHNPFAPPFDFLQKAFLPLLTRMGPKITAQLETYGFFPAGGGKFSVTIDPVAKLDGLVIKERGEIKRRLARAIVSGLHRNIADRELKVVSEQLGWTREQLQVEEVKNSVGPGNVLIAEIESESVTEVFTAFGERGLPAEGVSSRLLPEIRDYLASNAPVGVHLADQLLLPIALAGRGAFTTGAPSRHTLTNVETIKLFLPVDLKIQKSGDRWEVTCGGAV